MGNFANTLFSTLLGWLRSATAWLWSFLSNPESGGLMIWIAENWLTLIILLCAAGILIDLIVYLFRWQPYKVWASFFRRLFGRDKDDQHADRIRRRWIHADGTTSIEEVDPAEVMPEPEPQQLFTPQPEETYAESYAGFARPETLQPPMPTRELLEAQEAYPPEAPVYEPPVETPQDRPATRRRRFSQEAEELPLRYAPPPASEETPAYHEPYYPPQWKRPADTGASGVDIGGPGA